MLDKLRPPVVEPLGEVRGPDVVSDDPRWGIALSVFAEIAVGLVILALAALAARWIA